MTFFLQTNRSERLARFSVTVFFLFHKWHKIGSIFPQIKWCYVTNNLRGWNTSMCLWFVFVQKLTFTILCIAFITNRKIFFYFFQITVITLLYMYRYFPNLSRITPVLRRYFIAHNAAIFTKHNLSIKLNLIRTYMLQVLNIRLNVF